MFVPRALSGRRTLHKLWARAQSPAVTKSSFAKTLRAQQISQKNNTQRMLREKMQPLVATRWRGAPLSLAHLVGRKRWDPTKSKGSTSTRVATCTGIVVTTVVRTDGGRRKTSAKFKATTNGYAAIR
jgi:hypothetical protein